MMNADPVFEFFSDFNCPFCYALHERLHDLKMARRTTRVSFATPDETLAGIAGR